MAAEKGDWIVSQKLTLLALCFANHWLEMEIMTNFGECFSFVQDSTPFLVSMYLNPALLSNIFPQRQLFSGATCSLLYCVDWMTTNVFSHRTACDAWF